MGGVDVSKCTGHCYERFVLPLSPADIQKGAEVSKNRKEGSPIEY